MSEQRERLIASLAERLGETLVSDGAIRPKAPSLLPQADRQSLRSIVIRAAKLHGGEDALVNALARTVAVREKKAPPQIELGPSSESEDRYEFPAAGKSDAAELGRGAIGRVLQTRDTHLGREVAIKQLLAPAEQYPSRKWDEARFVREAKITGQLEHPNIVPVYELGRRRDGRLYYTMRMVRGRTLTSALTAAADLPARLALMGHFTRLRHAIAFAHSRGVVHRDIKPDNVMIGEFGETVVLDWGVAKLKSAPADDPQPLRPVDSCVEQMVDDSLEGTLVGTPIYMSPEQAIGAVRQVDERSDVWALGVVLYQLLTGTVPFDGSRVREVVQRIVAARYRPPRRLDARVPLELAAIVGRALRPRMSERYQSAKELADDVEAYLNGAKVQAYAYSSFELLMRFVARNRAAVLVGAVGVVVAMVLAISGAWRVVKARDRALAAEQLAVQNERQAEHSLAEALATQSTMALASGGLIDAQLKAAQALAIEERPDARGVAVRVANAHYPIPHLRHRLPTACSERASSAVALLGNRVACVTSAGLRLVDLPTGKASTLPVSGTPVAVAASSDGKRLATVTRDGHLVALGVPAYAAAQQVLLPLAAAAVPLTNSSIRLALSEKGKWIALAVGHHSWLWTASPLRQVAQRRWAQPITALAVRPDGSVAVGGRYGDLHLWREEVVKSFAGHAGTLLALKFAPRTQQLAAGSADKTVRVWELGGQQQRATTFVAFADAHTAAWSPDGRYLTFGTERGELHVVDMAIREHTARVPGHHGLVQQLAFTPDGRRIHSVGGSRWMAWKFPQVNRARLPNGSNVLAAVFQDQKTLVTAGIGSRGACIWDLSLGRCETRLPTSMDQVRAAAISPNGGALALGGSGGRLVLWDLRKRLPQRVLEGHTKDVRGLAFINAGTLLSAGLDRGLRIWRAQQNSATQIGKADAPVQALALLGNDRAAIGTRRGTVELWSLSPLKRQRVFQAHSDWVMALAASPDKAELLSAGAEGKVVVWSTKDFQQKFTRAAHRGRALGAAWSRDGELFATAGEDHAVRLWRSDGTEVATLKVHQGPVRTLQFSPSGKMLVSGSDDTTLRLWPVSALRRSGTELRQEMRARFRWALGE